MNCPICLRNSKQVGSWVKCPKEGMPVCMEHCTGCEFHSGWDTPIVHCFYGKKIMPEESASKRKHLAEG